MNTMIAEYRNLPGQHCGSTAMKNLLYYYCNLDLSEEVLFGLGSGIDCIHMFIENFNPPVLIFGRSITMEADLDLALGVDYRESIEPDNNKAWEDVRREVENGRPTMLSGDVFYLDYRKFKVHFPAHRFVLLGYDDSKEIAFLADRLDEEPQACSYGALAKSRNSPDGLSTLNLWGKFYGTEVKHTLEEACSLALSKSADRMLGHDTSQGDLLRAVTGNENLPLSTGLQGLVGFSNEVTHWREHKNCKFLASYASQAIEKFGNGGGNFRKLYASFLQWAQGIKPDLVPENLPALADRSAARWTQLSLTLERASEEPGQKSLWDLAADQAKEILGIESEIFEILGSTTSQA